LDDELIAVRAELRARRAEVERLRAELAESQAAVSALSQELAETNSGMVALYSELDAQSEQLRRTSELKSRFLRHVTHELRTPVGSTLRLCQLLLDRIDGELTAEQEHQVNLIRRSSETLADLVNDLLDLAKIEAGKTEVHPSWLDIGEVFVGLRGMLRPLVPAEVALIFESPAGLPPLYTDEGKLSQILRNFIGNALKFTERGEVRVAALALSDRGICFSVADTGIGIAPEDQIRVFDEFGQVSGPLQQRLRGSGLGLPLSKSLAELLGGAITLESEVGKGSIFYLTLPVTLPGAAEPPKRPQVQSAHPERLEKILIIDDDEAARYVLRRMVEPCAELILEASSGTEGLQRARTEELRLILLDLAMPDLDGREVLRRLKADTATRNIPVIVVTSRNLDARERRTIEVEAVAIVSKFAPPLEVTAQLQHAFERAGLSYQPVKVS
jgi:signal transduction histidine kinase/ActR/RegA family two-component response regulator